MTAPLTIVVDTREQRPLEFPSAIPVVFETLGEGDYAARGFETFARIERKSSADLWGTLHFGHDRFNRELARLGDIPRAALVVEDAESPDEVAARMRGSNTDRARFRAIVRALQWTGRVPIIWAGSRERAAVYVEWALRSVVEDFDPERLAVCEATAIAAGPYASAADLRRVTLATLFGLCAICARRPGPRPKVSGPGICACGRKERAA